MSTFRLVILGLRYGWRTHAGVSLAAAVATAVLVGALAVGDSIRATLTRLALTRLGNVHLAMPAGDRFFTTELAEAVRDELEAPIAAAISLKGLAIAPDRDRRANAIDVLGVDDYFWRMAPAGPTMTAPPSGAASADPGVIVSQSLATTLGVTPGDSIVIRIPRPSALSRDIPLGSETDETLTLRLAVKAIAADEHLGRFSLRSEQMPPLNAFVPLDLLQRAARLEGRANLLLIGSPVTTSTANDALRRYFALADAQAQLHQIPGLPILELRTSRVFLEPPLLEAAPPGQRSITYFVNALLSDDRSTPYSMVSAFDSTESELLPDDLAEDEIVVTDWLAEDLALEPGDELTLRYYVTGDSRSLTERAAVFRVRSIVATEPPGGDRYLMPEFPGLTDAQTPLDWEPPADLNIDLSRIRKKDELYWEKHRGAPKAFVSSQWAAQEWSTRFGTYTAVRWPVESVDVADLESAITRSLDPASLGLTFQDVRSPALSAAQQGYDFGQLFLGLSFFLIVSALLLTGLMFAFSVEQRTPQIGVLLAMGFTPGQVRRIFLGEGALLSLAGAAIGLPLGLLYTHAVLWGLTSRWNQAIGMTELTFRATPASMMVGVSIGVVMALAAMAWVLWRQGRKSARQLLAARYGIESSQSRGGRNIPLVLGGLCLGATGGLTLLNEAGQAAAAFFGAGSLLLLAGLLFTWASLRPAKARWSRRGARLQSRQPARSLVSLGWRNTSRRRGRSIATVAMLAAGTFLLIALNAFRLDPTHAPRAATLGFDFFAHTTIAISYDLRTSAGRQALGLDEQTMAGVKIVPLRLLEGDEASCLNLNRPQSPPLLGVDPSELDGEVWTALEQPGVPAIVDQAVAQWVLKLTIGDGIRYLDERGRPFDVTLAATLPNSILQGYVIVSETQFKERFSSVSGYRVFLIQAPADRVESVQKALERALADYGFTAMGTAQRLALFNAVQNTYLTIFSVLGGLGVLLGTVGLALVVLRNVLERRAELAAMQAMGFRTSAIGRLLLAEHWALIVVGLLLGLLSALLAVSPSLRTREMEIPYQTLSAILAAIAAGALLWTTVAVFAALRGRLVAALRND